MTLPTPILVRVFGEPKGQPRPRAFARKMGNGGFAARVYDAGTAEGWKSAIAAVALPLRPTAPLTGIAVTLRFYFDRPKSHYGTGRNAGALKASAPHWHESKPDLDNLAKAVLDCMTQLGYWRDEDIPCLNLSKRWATMERPQGMELSISDLELH